MTSSFSLPVSGGALQYSEDGFNLSKQSNTPTKIPLLNVLWAQVEDKKNVVVSVLVPGKAKWALKQVKGELLPGEENIATAEQWAKSLVDLAYTGLKSCRRLRVLINPVGGKGKARAIYENQVKPILEAAHCEFEMTVAEHHGHMIELAEKMTVDWDAIVVLSGDGGVHEVINGLAKNPQAGNAVRIPIAQVPTGSANAVCINTLGPKDGFNVAKACLNVVKGRPMKQNVYSITQGGKTYLSFLTQAAGLMADLDLGTEKLRWMGDSRFILGYLQGVVTKKLCPLNMEYKLVENDKVVMIANGRKNASKTHFYEEEELKNTGDSGDSLPWTKPIEETPEGWIKYEDPFIYLYGGGMPFVGRDLMQFPMATPSDGCIDLVLQNATSRGVMIKATVGAEKGEQYWINSQVYLKVSAFRVKPSGHGNLSIDGEQYPFEAFELHVHPGIVRFLSLDGRYIVDDFDFNHVPKKGKT